MTEEREDQPAGLGLKYLVIPGEVLVNWEFSLLDKVIFSVINMLDNGGNCYATNEYIANLVNAKPQTVSQAIKRLSEAGYLRKIGFDGRRRVIAVDEKYSQKYRPLLEEYNQTRLLSRSSADYDIHHRQPMIYIDEDKEEIIRRENKNNDSSIDESTGSSVPRSPRRRREMQNGNGYSQDAVKVFEHWNNKGKPFAKHQPSSKTGINALKAISLTLANGSTANQIIKAIDVYHSLLSSPHTKIMLNVVGHHVGLDQFFRFSTNTKSMMRRQKYPLKILSWYIEISKTDEQKLISKYSKYPTKKDFHPTISKKFSELYASRILKTDNPKYNQLEINKFRTAAIRLVKYREELIAKYGDAPPEESFVEYVFDALEKENFETISPGHLESDYTYERLLPQYLSNSAVLDHIQAGVNFT